MSFHIGAQKDQIAPKVLLPGDPLRAKWIAENFLNNSFCYSTIRNTLGFTGFYKGQKVSIQSTGMGIPSCLIYCAELINDYNAVDLVRVGTAGSLSDKLPTGSIIAVDRACSDSAALYRIINKCGPEFSGAFPKNSTLFENSFFPHEKLKLKALKTSEKLNIKTEEAPVFTSDHFYTPLPEKDYFKDISANKIFCIEMETAGLYAIASAHKVRALSLLTISDMIFDSSKSLSSEQKERGLEKMVKIALETLCT